MRLGVNVWLCAPLACLWAGDSEPHFSHQCSEYSCIAGSLRKVMSRRRHCKLLGIARGRRGWAPTCVGVLRPIFHPHLGPEGSPLASQVMAKGRRTLQCSGLERHDPFPLFRRLKSKLCGCTRSHGWGNRLHLLHEKYLEVTRRRACVH